MRGILISVQILLNSDISAQQQGAKLGVQMDELAVEDQNL
jgi:hypothetical protein